MNVHGQRDLQPDRAQGHLGQTAQFVEVVDAREAIVCALCLTVLAYTDEADAIRIAGDEEVSHGLQYRRRDPHRHICNYMYQLDTSPTVRRLQAVGDRGRIAAELAS